MYLGYFFFQIEVKESKEVRKIMLYTEKKRNRA